jgi:hypothetical protein
VALKLVVKVGSVYGGAGCHIREILAASFVLLMWLKWMDAWEEKISTGELG